MSPYILFMPVVTNFNDTITLSSFTRNHLLSHSQYPDDFSALDLS